MNKISISSKIYIAVLICLIAGFICLYTYCSISSGIMHTYVFEKGNLNVPQDGLLVSVSVSKQWSDTTLHPDAPFGAQYDGVLTNSTDVIFTNWAVDIEFTGEPIIDSSWNGTYVINGKNIYFISALYGDTPVLKSSDTFGAVMYTKYPITVKKCTLTGYRILYMWDTIWFWVLCAAMILWIILIIGRMIIKIRIRRYRERRKLDSEIITQSMNTFTGFIDAKDTYTRGHSIRVAAYASEIARRLRLSKNEVEQIYYITLMHDCGKIGIPDAVLKKPGKLTPEEYKEIQSHTTLGDEILKKFTTINGIRDGAHYHHERYDGNGYPEGLKGENIPLCARIICVADSYDAMSSTRCYRVTLHEDDVLRELEENRGTQFDPQMVDIMIEMIHDGFTKKVQADYRDSENNGEDKKEETAEISN